MKILNIIWRHIFTVLTVIQSVIYIYFCWYLTNPVRATIMNKKLNKQRFKRTYQIDDH